MIALASDHAGYAYKEKIRSWLTAQGYKVHDFGTCSESVVDYPKYILPAARSVAGGECVAGIILGGSGNGEAIVANKIAGIRCAVCWNSYTAYLAKAHNDANMIAIGQRTVSLDTAFEIIRRWMQSSFEGGRHERRIRMIGEAEKSQ